MKIERDKYYRTRGGDKIRVVCTDLKSVSPILGFCDHEQEVYYYYDNGRTSIHTETAFDLVHEWIEPKPKKLVTLKRALCMGEDGSYRVSIHSSSTSIQYIKSFVKWIDEPPMIIEVEE